MAIKIQFKGEEIPNVHSFRFVLWNSGTDVIRDDDIPRSGLQPKVTLSEGSKILSTRTFNSNRSQAKRKINDDRFYKFRFDYLNPGDAFMCELICTTESDGEVVATYSGNIIGAKVLKGKRKSLGLNDKLSTTMMLLLFGVAGYYMGSRAVELLLMGEYNKTVGPLLMLLGAVIAFSSLAIFVGKSIMHAMPVAYANFLETGKYEST